MIQLFSNSLGKEELNAIEKVFHNKWIGYGNECKKFEKEFGEKIGCNNVLMTNSCSSALIIALKTLGISTNDEIIIPTINFIAAPNLVLSCGAKPIFADVYSETLNLIPEEILRLKTNKTKAVILLHYGGHPAKMDEILEICEKYGLYIIEDSANSVFSKYKEKYCGTMGEIGCFSFDSMKILSCGEAGVITVNQQNYLNKAREERYFGFINRESGFESLQKNYKEWWKIYINTPASKYLPSDITGVIALEQLKKLDGFINRRKEIWNIYQEELKNIRDIVLPPEPMENCISSYYMYWIQTSKRDYLARYLISRGIYCSFRYYPLHMVEYYRNIDNSGKLKNAEEISRNCLNIPLHQNLTDQEVYFIIDSIRNGMKYE